MRVLVVAVTLLGCKGGADQAAKDIAAEEARSAEARRVNEKEMAPMRALEARYEKSAIATIAAHTPKDGTATIDLVKGRKIAPILATKTYPDGEQRPLGKLWCRGRCDKQPLLAQDPADAGVLVIADVRIVDAGKWVSKGDLGQVKELGNAFIHEYDVRAVLVPEDIVVARWRRYGFIPGISNHELMPVKDEELTDDMMAIAQGRVPVEEGRPPKTDLGRY